MTYESLHDDDDFRVNWCRNMDSFLFICARDDHAAPHLSLCASWAARRHRAVRHHQAVGCHWAARRDRAVRIHQQLGCPLTPATGLHADARHRDGRHRPAPYCRLGWYGQPFSKPTDHRSRVTYAYMILRTEWPLLECALMRPFWNVLKMECVPLEILQYALFGMSSKCDFNRMCSKQNVLFWNVFILAQNWICPLLNVPFFECAQNKDDSKLPFSKQNVLFWNVFFLAQNWICPLLNVLKNGYWNVLFLEWAVVEWTLHVMCPFWNVIKEKWALWNVSRNVSRNMFFLAQN